MKRIVSFLFLFSLLLAACAPATELLEPAETIEPTPTLTPAQEPQTEAQASVAPQETPLPAIVEAPIIEAPSIINIEMVDQKHGWGLTETEIVSTDDGGLTWYDVTPDGLKGVGYLVFADFLDSKRAWVQLPDMNNYPNGGTLYRTSDGGLTWDRFATPFSGGAFKFVDEKNGWVMADLGVGAGSMGVSIFKTTDGGKTWERTYTNDPNIEGASDSLPLGGIKSLILPIDAKTAWVGGVVYAPGQVYLFRSDNSGATWKNISLSLPSEAVDSELNVQGIVFVSPTEGLLAIRMTSETPMTLIFSTKDGGMTWSQLPVVFEGYGILETPSAKEMIFYAADQFYVTKDAGKTVRKITPDVQFGDSILDMSFANAETGWIVASDVSGEYILYKTADGGLTWAVLSR
ncbi:MAG: hypothetical protein HXY38_06425 [Chloroflexi bacterium]|nr:hypothetical protein [Chloroflexota bacterium]